MDGSFYTIMKNANPTAHCTGSEMTKLSKYCLSVHLEPVPANRPSGNYLPLTPRWGLHTSYGPPIKPSITAMQDLLTGPMSKHDP